MNGVWAVVAEAAKVAWKKIIRPKWRKDWRDMKKKQGADHVQESS